MRKEEIINKPEALVVLNWKQRIESVSGLACIHLNDVLSMELFTLETACRCTRRRPSVF